MNTACMETKINITEIVKPKDCVVYEHAGYQVRVHFNGDKTLVQCLKSLADRRIEG